MASDGARWKETGGHTKKGGTIRKKRETDTFNRSGWERGGKRGDMSAVGKV